jgi:ribosomal protein L11 methyltransferase
MTSTPSPGESWKLSLPCTRDEAEMLAEDIAPLGQLDPPPVLMTSEPDPHAPDDWRLDAYFEAEPDAATIALIVALVPSAARHKPLIERVPDADWITLSQAGLDPIAAGRFFVHTAAHADAVPRGVIALQIEAGQAFGTGQHETTSGCLLMLDRLRSTGARFDHIADIGTGTGLLAFAAHRLWPRAQMIASDIDPVAIEVSAENAAINGIRTGSARGAIALVTATGMAHRALRRRAPYDLLIANILAGPLITLAPVFAAATMPGGSILLAGLLNSQADAVARAYRRQGFRLADRIDRGDWPTLRMVRRG